MGRPRKPRLRYEVLEPRLLLFSGQLDETFSEDGFVIQDFFQRLDFANAAAIQDDGMILVAGSAGRLNGFQPRTDVALVRYTTNGELDPDFGEDGFATIDFGDGVFSQANAIALQDDGKIVVVGQIQPSNQLIVIRLTADGTLDEEFNDGGVVIIEASSSGNDVAIQPDGKIVVVGDATGTFGFQFLLARLKDDGSFDDDFGPTGIQVMETLNDEGSARGIALQDDKIIVTGHGKTTESNSSSFITARFNSAGELDASFGDNGNTITSITNSSEATDVLVDEENRVIIAGSDAGELTLIRYTSEGDLDLSFNETGVVTFQGLNPTVDGTTGGALALESDGKILVTSSGGNDFVVLKLVPDGSLDESFNGTGMVTTDFQVTNDSSTAIAIQDDGYIVVAGVSGGDWAVARYENTIVVANPWQNPDDRLDVSGDGNVVPLDVLRIVNELNRPTVADSTGRLPATRPDGAPYYDVDGNGFITPLDALGVINFLNRPKSGDGELATAASRNSLLADFAFWDWVNQLSSSDDVDDGRARL